MPQFFGAACIQTRREIEADAVEHLGGVRKLVQRQAVGGILQDMAIRIDIGIDMGIDVVNVIAFANALQQLLRKQLQPFPRVAVVTPGSVADLLEQCRTRPRPRHGPVRRQRIESVIELQVLG